jgi:hypothetical protein
MLCYEECFRQLPVFVKIYIDVISEVDIAAPLHLIFICLLSSDQKQLKVLCQNYKVGGFVTLEILVYLN